jgi:hypothetical protein
LAVAPHADREMNFIRARNMQSDGLWALLGLSEDKQRW